ncbi:hypothetical protein SBRY_40035 [Actinacidiphila bryophytorum]|uniref:Uncharacterized protein n=1 Tax=Actinacidiphila bryophytorum TaxID=1436133 RepID=A0A9W4H2A6_9ACTN|nr:hypothetical protein SBRY_40035 [Actinacidiphila bryophytorum]
MQRITVFTALALAVLGLIGAGAGLGAAHQSASRTVMADTGWPEASSSHSAPTSL